MKPGNPKSKMTWSAFSKRLLHTPLGDLVHGRVHRQITILRQNIKLMRHQDAGHPPFKQERKGTSAT